METNTKTNNGECHPGKDNCSKLAYARKYEYILQLAADLNRLCQEDPEEYGELSRNYGNRDSIAANHIIDRHPETMPSASMAG